MGATRLLPALFLSAFALSAQAPPTPGLTFDVASIKPSGPLDPQAIAQGKMRIGMKVDGAICDIGAFSLRDLIRTAYEVKDYQISGIDPGSPMTVQRFNIQATMPAGATEKQVPEMLRALLADRFKLTIHKETKEHNVFALVVAKGGPKLKDAEPDAPPPETPEEPKKGETVIGQGSGQMRISGSMEDKKGVTLKGGPQGAMKMSMVDGKMHMEAAKMDMSTLCEFAARFVDRPVVDMTDLKGKYQIALDLTMDDLKNIARAAGMAMPGGGPSGGSSTAPAEASDPSGSSIYQSLQNMGLKLDARKAPIEAIVVDHVEKMPTEN